MELAVEKKFINNKILIRLGGLGFAFFFIKGLAWLAVVYLGLDFFVG
tara:strand:+ start:268 stop:408 length:141 start_codon:yes stop_codon:yes gene_type:complete